MKTSVEVNVKGNLYMAHFKLKLTQPKKVCVMCGTICDENSFSPCVQFERIIHIQTKTEVDEDHIQRLVISAANDKMKKQMQISTLKKGYPFECNQCAINFRKG